jgi:hypothetical protein
VILIVTFSVDDDTLFNGKARDFNTETFVFEDLELYVWKTGYFEEIFFLKRF